MGLEWGSYIDVEFLKFVLKLSKRARTYALIHGRTGPVVEGKKSVIGLHQSALHLARGWSS